jgi:hypothetical protein
LTLPALPPPPTVDPEILAANVNQRLAQAKVLPGAAAAVASAQAAVRNGLAQATAFPTSPNARAAQQALRQGLAQAKAVPAAATAVSAVQSAVANMPGLQPGLLGPATAVLSGR